MNKNAMAAMVVVVIVVAAAAVVLATRDDGNGGNDGGPTPEDTEQRQELIDQAETHIGNIVDRFESSTSGLSDAATSSKDTYLSSLSTDDFVDSIELADDGYLDYRATLLESGVVLQMTTIANDYLDGMNSALEDALESVDSWNSRGDSIRISESSSVWFSDAIDARFCIPVNPTYAQMYVMWNGGEIYSESSFTMSNYAGTRTVNIHEGWNDIRAVNPMGEIWVVPQNAYIAGQFIWDGITPSEVDPVLIIDLVDGPHIVSMISIGGGKWNMYYDGEFFGRNHLTLSYMVSDQTGLIGGIVDEISIFDSMRDIYSTYWSLTDMWGLSSIVNDAWEISQSAQ